MTTDLHEALKAERPNYESHAAFARAIRDAGYDMALSTLKDWLAAPVGEKRYREKDGDRALLAWLEREETSSEETYRQDGDTLTAHKIIGERVTSLEEAISFFDVDTDKWRTDKWECTTYETPMKRKTSEGAEETMQVVNYRVWVRWERARDREGLKAYADGLLDKIKNADLPPLPNGFTRNRETGDLAGLLSLVDVHHGNLVWPEMHPTGDAWNLEISERVFRECVDFLVEEMAGRNMSEVIVPLGHDDSHVDTANHTTTAGTSQVTSGYWQHIARVVARCNRYAIDRATEVAPVIVKIIGGNHNRKSAFHHGQILEAVYENNPNVEIDNQPTIRKAHMFGRCFFMFDHGKEMKLSDLPMLASNVYGEMWGKAKWKEIHTGHKHHRSKETVGDFKEIDGAIVRISPSLCPADAWHQRGGYSTSVRGSEAFLYHRKAGYAGNIPFNVLPEHSSTV